MDNFGIPDPQQCFKPVGQSRPFLAGPSGWVSQFRFKKSFASKQNLAKQKQFRFVSLQFRETTKKVSLRFAS